MYTLIRTPLGGDSSMIPCSVQGGGNAYSVCGNPLEVCCGIPGGVPHLGLCKLAEECTSGVASEVTSSYAACTTQAPCGGSEVCCTIPGGVSHIGLCKHPSQCSTGVVTTAPPEPAAPSGGGTVPSGGYTPPSTEPEPIPEEEEGFPYLLATAGVGAVALLGYAIWRKKRKKR